MKTIKQIELRSKRLSLAKEDEAFYNTSINTPKHVVDAVRAMLPADLDYERFVCLAVSSNNKPLAIYEAGRGGIDNCPVDAREVFSPAVMLKASGLVVAHNHPSGNLQPSEPDVSLTKKLCKAAELLDIRLLDHIIMSDKAYLSMREKGLFNEEEN